MSFTVTTRVAMAHLRTASAQPASLAPPDRDVTCQPDHHLGGPRRSLTGQSLTGAQPRTEKQPEPKSRLFVKGGPDATAQEPRRGAARWPRDHRAAGMRHT